MHLYCLTLLKTNGDGYYVIYTPAPNERDAITTVHQLSHNTIIKVVVITGSAILMRDTHQPQLKGGTHFLSFGELMQLWDERSAICFEEWFANQTGEHWSGWWTQEFFDYLNSKYENSRFSIRPVYDYVVWTGKLNSDWLIRSVNDKEN